MKKFIRKVALVVSVLAGTLVAKQAIAEDVSKLDEVVARGKLIVGVSSESPPFGFIDDHGELVGFDVDIAKLIARSLFDGKENIEFVKQPFSARWANVNTNKVDMGIQLTTIYADRLLNVSFTRSYIDSALVVVTRAESNISKIEDLNSTSHTISILTAPIEKDIADRLWPDAQTLTFDSTAAQLAALQSKRATAVILDLPVANYYATLDPSLKVMPELVTDLANNAIFMKPGDFKWWYYLDTMVSEMRGGSLYSEYSTIYKKWFGVEPKNLNAGR